MKKIMFNERYGLTEAVASGRKTQTRRIVKMTPIDEQYAYEKNFPIGSGNIPKALIEAYSRYQVGEVVAVAQCYKDIVERIAKKGYDTAKWMDEHHITKNLAGWLNKMFVKASLMIFKIRITNVRVERLQEIPDDDCIKEGVGISATDNRIGYPFSIPFNYYVGEDKEGYRYSTPREAYAALIDRISGKGTWERNPWVFVYDFELVK